MAINNKNHPIVVDEFKVTYTSGIVKLVLNCSEKWIEFGARDWDSHDRFVVEVNFGSEIEPFYSKLMEDFDSTDYYPMLYTIEKNQISLIYIPLSLMKEVKE